MSLINNALKDLENRNGGEKQEQNKNNVLSDLQAPVLTKKKKIPSRFFVYFLILLALILLAVLYLYNSSKAKTIVVKPAMMEVVPQPTPQPQPVQAVTLTALKAVTFEAKAKSASLLLTLGKSVHYTIEQLANSQQLLVTLYETKLKPDLPELKENSWLSKATVKQVQDNVEIMVEMQPEVVLETLQLQGETTTQLHIGFLHTGAETPGSMQKTAIPLTRGEQAEQAYQEAMALVTEQQPGAIAKLQLAVELEPGYMEARKSLIVLLLKVGRMQEASQMILKGLEQSPDDPQLVKLWAHCLVQQGQLRQAVSVLQQHAPLLQSDPSYYSFLAFLYQQVGQYQAAARAYDQLVQYNPDNGLWWLGLGLALESTGEHNAAVQAYTQALQHGDNLSPGVRAYLEGKLTTGQ